MSLISFTIVTSNQHKLDEYARLFPKDIVTFDSAKVELEEIQSFDPKVVIEHKARQAYQVVGRPVFVEDVSAGLDKFEGLPGPFVKFFEQKLGKGALYKLAGEQESAATITCTIGIFDGVKMLFAEGIEHGRVVSPRGEIGWGFDFVFVPDGSSQTFAEMEPAGKALVSHRSAAVKDLLAKLKEL